MKRNIELSLLVLSSSLAIKMNRHLISTGIDAVTSLLVAVVFAVAISRVFLFLILHLPMRYEWARPLLDPRARAEGTWLQTIRNMDDHKFSIIFIYYNTASGHYLMKGNNFNAHGDNTGNWSSLLLEIDAAEDKLIFPYIGTHQRLDSQTVFGFGIADLLDGGGVHYSRGNGHFIDAAKQSTPYTFDIQRLSSDVIKSIVDKKNLDSLADCAKLIQSYAQPCRAATLVSDGTA